MSIEIAQRSGLRQAAGLVTIALAVVLAVPIAILAWMVVFDSTGLDTTVPDVVFATVLPGLSVASLPAGVAGWLYDRRTGLAVGVVVAAVAMLVTLYYCGTTQGVAIC